MPMCFEKTGKPSPSKKNTTPEIRAKLKDMVQAGLSMTKISKELKVSTHVTTRWLKEEKLEVKQRKRSKLSDAKIKKLLHEYQNGASMLSLHKKFNVSERYVNIVIEDAGLKRDRKGNNPRKAYDANADTYQSHQFLAEMHRKRMDEAARIGK